MIIDTLITTPDYRKLVFDFGKGWRVFMTIDGSGFVEFSGDKISPAFLHRIPSPNPYPTSRQTKRAPYFGGLTRPSMDDLGYKAQDEITRRFANVEHTALHLWIDYAQNTQAFGAPAEDDITRARLIRAIQKAFLINHGDLEEKFITGVQMMANGLEPDILFFAGVEESAFHLGLKHRAVVGALAFINRMRARYQFEFGK